MEHRSLRDEEARELHLPGCTDLVQWRGATRTSRSSRKRVNADDNTLVPAHAIEQGCCKYSQFQHLTECSRQHISLQPRPRQHDFKTTPTTKGWRFALMPPWDQGTSEGRPWVAQMHHKRLQAANKTHTLARRRSTFVNYLHGSGAGSLKRQTYDATRELDDKIRLRVFPRSGNVQ